jgi:hypothetical protein
MISLFAMIPIGLQVTVPHCRSAGIELLQLGRGVNFSVRRITKVQ